MKTSLKNLRENSPCIDGWKTVLKSVDKTKVDDEPLPLLDILKSNGFTDALWALRGVEGSDNDIRFFLLNCMAKVKHLLVDQYSVDALNTVNRFINGEATIEELDRANQGAVAASGRIATRTANAIANGGDLKMIATLVSVSYVAIAVALITSPTINKDAQACCFWIRNAHITIGGNGVDIEKEQEQLFIDMCNS